MKIKTISKKINPAGMAAFDQEVNAALAEGWIIGKRDTLPGVNLGTVYFTPSLYAELVLLDPVPEPEQPDPLEALRVVQAFCDTVPSEKCLTPECPLSPWCHNYTEDGISPSDWLIPGEEAAP